MPTLKEQLVTCAARLVPPTEAATSEFSARVDALVDQLDAVMLAHPNFERLIGLGNADKMRTNHRNHLKYMVSVFRLYDPHSFVETVIWVLRTYQSHGFSLEYWAAMLPAARETVRQTLAAQAEREIAPFYEWLAASLKDLAEAGADPSVWERLQSATPSHGDIP